MSLNITCGVHIILLLYMLSEPFGTGPPVGVFFLREEHLPLPAYSIAYSFLGGLRPCALWYASRCPSWAVRLFGCNS